MAASDDYKLVSEFNSDSMGMMLYKAKDDDYMLVMGSGSISCHLFCNGQQLQKFKEWALGLPDQNYWTIRKDRLDGGNAATGNDGQDEFNPF